jgi:fucose permease
MLRALLIGLAIFVIAVVLITAVAHLLYYGFLFLIAIGVGFLAFRAGRWSRNRR